MRVDEEVVGVGEFKAVITRLRPLRSTPRGTLHARSTRAAWALSLCVVCALGGCGASPCDERATWASRDTAACVTCERDCRTMAADAPPSGCDGELACVARCPDRSATTCGCSESCLRTERCKTAWQSVMSCYVSRCREACR